jgi:hypothetical protein
MKLGQLNGMASINELKGKHQMKENDKQKVEEWVWCVPKDDQCRNLLTIMIITLIESEMIQLSDEGEPYWNHSGDRLL